MAWTPDATDLYYINQYNTEQSTGISGEELYYAQLNNGFDFNSAYLEEAQNLEDIANGLTTDQKYQIKATYDSAKATGNTKLAKIMDEVFKYGKVALEILVGTGIIKTASNINPGTIDVDAYDQNVALSKQAVANKSTGSTNTPQSNSTYFGIDFSSPIVWLIIIGIVILFFAFNSSSNKPQQVYIPQQPARR